MPKNYLTDRSWRRGAWGCWEENQETGALACRATLLATCPSPPGWWSISRLCLQLNCLQPVHGVHHLRNILLFWEASPHEQGSGGILHCLFCLQSLLHRLRAGKKSSSNFSTFQKMIARCQYQPNRSSNRCWLGADSEWRPAKTTFTGDGFDSPTSNSHSGWTHCESSYYGSL